MAASTKAYNRGKLRRQVQAGKMEARISYSYDGREVRTTDWKPCRWIESGGSFGKEGQINFSDRHFTSKSGIAYVLLAKPDVIELTYGDTCYQLREVKV